jgi:hypothetical protein
MQAIFPISMVVAVLAAIGIAFLLPSLLSRKYAEVPSHGTMGLGFTNKGATNWGGTDDVPIFTQEIINTPQGLLILETPVDGNFAPSSKRSTRPFPKVDNIPNSLKEYGKGPNNLVALEQFLEEKLLEKTGAYPRKHMKSSRKQRRSRRKNE